ncbi:hypothetical protein [Streptomyces sp. NPDC029003]|uniref:hypothetical protein n=1 Tax=Streptomyces sp. NPDC029003 TaxID=3155125 RepID=UPI0033EC9927
MNSDQFTAIVGLGGVALGIGGTLIAARVQLRGSQAQAEATRRAAETTAVTQYAATLMQQNRAAQRAVYVALLEAANAFGRAVDQICWRSSSASGELLQERMAQLLKSFSAVELEGPSAVIESAERIIEFAETIAAYLSGGQEYRPWRKLRDTDRHGSDKETAARLAVEALDALRTVTRTISLEVLASMRRSSDIVAFTEALGESGTAWRQKYARAREMLVPLCTMGVLESPEVDVLLRDAGLSHYPFDKSIDQWDSQMHSAIYGFVNSARQQLNNTKPENLEDQLQVRGGERSELS